MENKRSRGRQVIPMQKIENEEDRYATFSKRRKGLYKKASELCTLCEADVGIVIFSPTGKPFSFGHPSIESVSYRFTHQNQLPNDSSRLVDAHRRAQVNELNQRLNELSAKMEFEKERGRKLDEMIAARKEKGWWEAPDEELNKEQVGHLRSWLIDAQFKISSRLNELCAGASSSSFQVENTPQLPHPSTSVGISFASSSSPTGYGHGGMPF